MAMTRPPVEVRRFDPLRLPEGIPLQAFTNLAVGPSMDFTGRPVDLLQRAHSRRLAEMEGFRPEQERYSQELADMEGSRDAQDRYLAAIQQILDDQAQYSQMLAQRETAGVPLDQMASAFGPIRQRAGLPKSFDPEGSDYDMATARRAGLAPDETGHWPSRDPKTGMLLKGRNHETWPLTVEGERKAGMEIYKKDGRYYSRPAVTRVILPNGEPVLDEVTVGDAASFSEAFRAARKADASIFHWRGKVYSTKVK